MPVSDFDDCANSTKVATSGAENGTVRVSALKLWPNPARNELYFEIRGAKTKWVTLQVVNGLGHVSKGQTVELKSGVY
ncbi:MAG TPA: hypothetical protein ENJ82_18045, partial [Bacteroidetes bacterium]|nr:hypothetical protein [Bacteroidota bacterium]